MAVGKSRARKGTRVTAPPDEVARLIALAIDGQEDDIAELARLVADGKIDLSNLSWFGVQGLVDFRPKLDYEAWLRVQPAAVTYDPEERRQYLETVKDRRRRGEMLIEAIFMLQGQSESDSFHAAVEAARRERS